MREEIKNNGITWINITNPVKEDIGFLEKNFNVCRTVTEEFIPPIKRSKVEEYQDYVFIVIHFPVFNKKTRKTISRELDIILFKDIFITNCAGAFPELKKVFNSCRADENKKNHYLKNSAFYLAYRVLDTLIDSQLPMLDHIDEHISEIQEEIFNGNERKMVSEIAIVKNDIISFRRTIKPQRMVLETLARITPKITDENLFRHSSEVIGSNIKVWNTLENHKEMIEALEHTNESLLSYKLNDTMKILTAISVIMFPMSLIANMFGMNVAGIPFSESVFGFWIIVLFMFTATLLSVIFFRYKKWL